MTTARRLLIALGICLAAAFGCIAAFAAIVFGILRICDVDGASWSAVGWATVVGGLSLAALAALDRLDVEGGSK